MFDFELSFTGLCVLTFTGADKRKPDEVNVLMAKTTRGGKGMGGMPGHHHRPRLSFSPADLSESSDRNHAMVPTPSGETIGLLDLAGLITISLDPHEPGGVATLSAMWRPDNEAESEAPLDDDSDSAKEQQQWLNWVPNLETVSPGIQPPTQGSPFAGVDEHKVSSRVRITRGELTAAKIGRDQNGKIQIFKFKPKGNKPAATQQAIAEFVVLRFSQLTLPVQFEGLPAGSFGLVGQQPGKVVRASITNLPEVEIAPEKRLTHFAQFFDLVGLNKPEAALNLPETPDITDTSFGAICPCATYAEVK